MTDFLFKHSSYYFISPLYDIDVNAPFYFMVEGVDGVGKTTFCESLQTTFNTLGIPCQTVHEPFEPANIPPRPTAQDFQNDREKYYEEHPLDNKTWLISDRSVWSTLAYNKCSDQFTRDAERWYETTFEHYNKVLFYLTASEKAIVTRLEKRGNMEPIEEDRAYQLKVKKKFKELVNNEELHVDVRAIINMTYSYPLSDKPSLLKKHKYLDTNFTPEEIEEALNG